MTIQYKEDVKCWASESENAFIGPPWPHVRNPSRGSQQASAQIDVAKFPQVLTGSGNYQDHGQPGSTKYEVLNH